MTSQTDIQPDGVNNAPIISVVIPAYKVKYLEAALCSVLDQDFLDYEIIICDDCPTDDVSDFVELFLAKHEGLRIQYSKNPRRLWGGGTLSRCIELARGKYIKPVFDDDMLRPGCLRTFVEVLDANPEASLVTSRRTLIDEDGNPLSDTIATAALFDDDTYVHGDDLVSFLGDTALNFIGEPTSIMFRREHVMPELGRLFHLGDQTIPWLGDLAMSVKLLRQGHMAMLQAAYSSFRVSKEQFSQRGRDTPGIGEKGHSDFKRKIRELGWYRTENNHLIRVRPLNDPSKGFAEIDLAARIGALIQYFARQEQTKNWGVPEWLTDRAPSASRSLAIQTMLQANPDVGTLGAAVIVPEGTDVQALMVTLESLGAQQRPVDGVLLIGRDIPDEAIGDDIELLRRDEHWTKQLSDRIAQGGMSDFLWILYAGDRLVPHATLTMGEYRLRKPDPLVWYADEAILEAGVPANPMLKPDFNIDLLRSYPYIGRNPVLSTAAVQALGGLDDRVADLAPIDLIWRLVERVGPPVVAHVPEVLQLGGRSLMDWVRDVETMTWFPAVTQAHFVRMGLEVKVEPGLTPGLQRIEYPLTVQPLVSIIIPTRDQLPVLRACVEGLMERTAYPHYELLVVDNGSVEPDAVEYLAALEGMGTEQIRVLRWPQAFDFAAMNSFAVGQARGEVLLFLNNDVLFSSSTRTDWLERLLAQAMRAEVGAVGTRLDLPGGGVEQCGLVLGMDNSVGLAFRGLSASRQGYMNRLLVQQNVSALSASCMMIRRKVFDEVGGFDAESFPVYYADADLCMKLTQTGYLLALEPETGLQHMGGATRLLTEEFGLEARPDDKQRDRLYARWLPQLARDPNYHPAFGKHSPGFNLSQDAARIQEPLPGRPLPVVLAVHSDWQGCGYYRILHPYRALADELRVDGGLKLHDFHFTDVARIEPDVIVLQGAWRNPGILDQIRRYREITGAKVVLEFDDYIPNIPTRSIYRRLIPQGAIKDMRRAIEQVDWLVVSTPVLAQEYARYHDDIRVALNGLHPEWWRGLTGRRKAGRKMRVGWAGGVSHTGDLAEIRSVVKDLEDEVEWVFMGMQPDGVRCEYHPGVVINEYPARLANLNLDLAVVPLEINQFNRCKSNLRLLELGACGVPVICTEIEPYQGGLPVTLVRNKHQAWVEAIRSHLADPDALAHAGDKLQETVLRDWMLEGSFLDQWERAWGCARL